MVGQMRDTDDPLCPSPDSRIIWSSRGSQILLLGERSPCWGFLLFGALEFFTNAPQCKNANIANFVLAVPLEIDYTNRVYNLEI